MEDSIPNITAMSSKSAHLSFSSVVRAQSHAPISLLFLVLFGKILHGMNVKTKNETVFIADLDIYEICNSNLTVLFWS